MNIDDVELAWGLQSVDPTPWEKLSEDRKIQYAITYATAIAVIEHNQKLQAYATEMKSPIVTVDLLIEAHRMLHQAKTECNEKLHTYATEMKCGSVTLDELIESHRELRKANHERHETYLAIRKEASEKGIAEAREQALKDNWFSRERLVEMSVGELAKALMY